MKRIGHRVAHEGDQRNDLNGPDSPCHDDHHEEGQAGDHSHDQQQHQQRQQGIQSEDQHAAEATQGSNHYGENGAVDDGHFCLCLYPCLRSVPCHIPSGGGLGVETIHKAIPLLLEAQDVLRPGFVREVHLEAQGNSRHCVTDDPELLLHRQAGHGVVGHLVVEIPRWKAPRIEPQSAPQVLDEATSTKDQQLCWRLVLAHGHHSPLCPRVAHLEVRIIGPALSVGTQQGDGLRRANAPHHRDVDLFVGGHRRRRNHLELSGGRLETPRSGSKATERCVSREGAGWHVPAAHHLY
mmetsp:Transcript_27292/g.43975  ORF Transcript_27292/g.43975 Transcript_27292/m.43975 type:complete len:295 (-) Transcript_27292:8-892(-)